MEGFTFNKAEKPKNPDAWRESKEKAPERARTHLKERGLTVEIEEASLEDLNMVIEQIPMLMAELTFDASNEVKNENRNVVQALSVHLNLVKKYVSYLTAPNSPLIH